MAQQSSSSKPNGFQEEFERHRRGLEQHMKTVMDKASELIRVEGRLAEQESDRKAALAEVVAMQQIEIANLRKEVSDLVAQLTAEREVSIIVRAERDRLEGMLALGLDNVEEETPQRQRKEPRRSDDADISQASQMSTDRGPADNTQGDSQDGEKTD